MNRRLLLALVAAVFVVAIGGPIVATLTDSTKPEQKVAPLDAASATADQFLEQRVQESGVVGLPGEQPTARRQADGLLIAVAVADRSRFGAIWGWTEQHLVRNGTELASSEGGDAADAGAWLDMTRALLVGAQKFQQPELVPSARGFAEALASRHVVLGSNQKAYLASSTSGTTIVVAPSAHSPRAEAALVAAGDSSWANVLTTERDLVASLDGSGDKPRLVPDLAEVRTDGSVLAVPAPGSTAPSYGRPAASLLTRLAESCDAADRAQAGRMWQLLSRSRDSRTSVDQTLDGKSRGSTESPVGAVAAAAGAHAVGAEDDALAMLQAAEHFTSDRSSTEDLAAVALGRVMLTTTWLGGC